MYRHGPSTFISGSAPILPPDAYFYILRVAGSQVGVGSITVDTLADGVRVTERLGIDLPIQANSARSQYTTQFVVGTDLRLREFTVTVPGPAAPVVQRGSVEADSSISVWPGTGEPRWRLRMGDASLIPPLAAPVALALQQKLQTGERLEVPVFDPLSLTHRTISLAVVDDSVFLVPDSADFDSAAGAWLPAHSDTLRAWKIEWSQPGHSFELWVDRRGLPIRTISPAGLSLDRSAFEIVTINYRRRRAAGSPLRPSGVIPRTALAASVEPDSGITEMRVRFRTELGPWALPLNPETATQYMEGDVALARRASLDSTAVSPDADSSMATWLLDGPFLGLTDTTIANRARTILAGEAEPRAQTLKLLRWVSQNIERAPHPVVRRAATVLRERKADVDGHTLLFLALARSAGLPARSVSGILLAGERFYFHSWAEVYLGQWVPVDPTWGEFPAAANRIAFGQGTLARPLDLLPLVAGIDVELISLTQHP